MMITRTMGSGRIGGLGIVPAASAARSMRICRVPHNELFGIFGSIRTLAGCSAKTFSVSDIDGRIGPMTKNIQEALPTLAQKLDLQAPNDFSQCTIKVFVSSRAKEFFAQAASSVRGSGDSYVFHSARGTYIDIAVDLLAISNLIASVRHSLDEIRTKPNMDPADAISHNDYIRRGLREIWQRAIYLQELFDPTDQACERIEIEE